MARSEKLAKAIKKFSFQQVIEEHVQHIILSIDDSKVTREVDLPEDMLKVTLDIHLSLITKINNFSFENGCFPDDKRLTTVSPVFFKKR